MWEVGSINEIRTAYLRGGVYAVLTPLVQQLVAIFLEVNTIPDEELRRLQFASGADAVLEGIVSRFVPA
jgi:hypothetical protein